MLRKSGKGNEEDQSVGVALTGVFVRENATTIAGLLLVAV